MPSVVFMDHEQLGSNSICNLMFVNLLIGLNCLVHGNVLFDLNFKTFLSTNATLPHHCFMEYSGW